MKKNTYRVAGGVALLAAISGILWYGSYTLRWHLWTQGIAIYDDGFRVSAYDEFFYGGNKNIELTAKSNDRVTEEEAIKRTEGIFQTMDAHFAPEEILGIYADLIAAVAQVPDQLKPQKETVEIQGRETPSFLAFADRYFSYMVMTEDQAIYKGMLTLVYCPEAQKLVNIEILSSKHTFGVDRAKKQLESFTCN
ncbi:MAG: hypothetical protein UY31_C0054G0004 [Candidatus Wolfebacteria bacterium GW2011_GWE1_48_7]|nr:MAG: hypothetical protein UY31_C0054G0004 [Candidatus Wolfebacteria bacterium GW2011_GWE1_48_7]